LPTLEEIEKAGKLKAMENNNVNLDLELFPEDLESFYPFAEIYMGKQRKKLPARLRTLKVPKPIKKKKRLKRKRKKQK